MTNKEKQFQLFAKDKKVSSLNLFNYKKRAVSRITADYGIMPHVVEERSQNMSVMDVFSRLMMDRVIFLGTEIDDYVANVINAQLLFLEIDNDEEPIWLYINSPGGEVYSGLAIYDTMNIIDTPVHTCVSGMAASMAFVLSISGTRGSRYALEHSRLMQHQPSGGVIGDAKEMEIEYKEIKLLKNSLYKIIADKTGQNLKKVAKDCERDYWLSAAEAKKYGAIDDILTKNNRKPS